MAEEEVEAGFGSPTPWAHYLRNNNVIKEKKKEEKEIYLRLGRGQEQHKREMMMAYIGFILLLVPPREGRK